MWESRRTKKCTEGLNSVMWILVVKRRLTDRGSKCEILTFQSGLDIVWDMISYPVDVKCNLSKHVRSYRLRGFDEDFGMSELILVLVHVYGAQEMQHTLLLIPPPCWPRLFRQNRIPETEKEREDEEAFTIWRMKSYLIKGHIFNSYKCTKRSFESSKVEPCVNILYAVWVCKINTCRVE